MSLFNLISNTVEGVTQTALGTVKLVASPITQLVDLESEKSHAEDAVDNISDGINKIGKTD